MSDFNRGYATAAPADMAVDAGLRGFMLGVYNKMALGLVLSGALAFLTSAYPPVRDLLYVVDARGALAGFTLLGTIIRFAPVVMLIGSMFLLRNPSPRASGILYWSIVSTIGAGLGVWLLAYTGSSVAMAFFVSAAAFGGLSLFGYTTKRDLSPIGSFLVMAMWGLFIAGLASFLLPVQGNRTFQLIFSVIGLIVFAGLTAFDTQRLKLMYYDLGGDQARMSVATNLGALNLYINFINIFQFLLAIFGGRR